MAYEPHIHEGVTVSREVSEIRDGGWSAAYAIETFTKRLAVFSEPIPSVDVPPIECGTCDWAETAHAILSEGVPIKLAVLWTSGYTSDECKAIAELDPTTEWADVDF